MALPIRVAPSLACGNCFTTVPQDMWYAEERFGKFQKVLDPGFHCLGPDCCQCCVTLRGISNRVVQQDVEVSAKRPESKEGLLVKVVVAVQMQVNPDNAYAAFYRMSDVENQVAVHVTDSVQSVVQRLHSGKGTVKKQIETLCNKRLQEVLAEYGYNVTKTLCVGYFFADQGVADADRQIAEKRNEVESTKLSADADKIRVVKAAEAERDAHELQGEGIARQRAAIADGLRDSFRAHGGPTPSTKEISELLLISENFDTLRAIGRGNTSTIFLPQTSEPHVGCSLGVPAQEKMA